MSSLSAFAAHARAMATAEHKPECDPRDRVKRWVNVYTDDEWGGHYQPPKCAGCVTDADRALWVRLADEAEAYLSRHEEVSLL